ncbi:ferrochelatase [Brachyspira hyodysenteriae]|uniref:ferrochelatase n=1 Tax=Brachyspira hyodysenteriae TaxID=159 RepID=UPI0022CD9468|nr:ferrochelatase [Brachyspira hyodysenteriae]MCZ9838772.1 ferrochelatase [Brachyspira hyodysenteriae]MCZ9848061.1 ferrochelatase [Brachyspira hyodysenteriae]MCZ9851892.1 ferrochelatase [Brachyspira hyodysenteriae]MCZ9859370.1 ferrochelatase [Brachyspira hyodysenteriae]MCZ9870594.1 ferrochelatase [Brachyspira hyodysenteriae]
MSNRKETTILLNMGGPRNFDEINTFLVNMFNDYYILNIKNSFIRGMIAKKIVNKIKPDVIKHYEAIGGKSPINEYTEKLINKLNELDKSKDYKYIMNYTPPYSYDVLKELKEKNIDNITLFSMYPQYSEVTVKSSLENVYKAMKKLKYNPKINIIDRYYDNEYYNDSVVNLIKNSIADKNAEEYILIFSAHSIPKMYADKGDPYEYECNYNVQVLIEKLNNAGLNFKDIVLSYQSKIGKIEWLEPSTIDTIKKYSGEKLIIYPLAFTIDNSETIYEIDIEYREEAINKYNIKDFILCPCLNDNIDFAESIIEISNSYNKQNLNIHYNKKIV